MPQLQISSDQLAILASSVPRDNQDALASALKVWAKNDSFNAADMNEIATALERRDLMEAAESIYRTRFESSNSNPLFSGFALIDYYLRRGCPLSAEEVYGHLLDRVSKPSDENMMAYMNTSDDLSRIIEKISSSSVEKTAGYAGILERAKLLKEENDKRKSELECLQLAERLCDTGSQLELKGDLAGAEKMYDSALDIRRKNLSGADNLTAEVLVDCARVSDESGEFEKSKGFYTSALGIYKTRGLGSAKDLEETLQAYGSMLTRWKHEPEAGSIYSEAKKLHDSMQSK